MIWNPSTIFCALGSWGTYQYQRLQYFRKKDHCVWCSHGEFIIVCLATEPEVYQFPPELLMPPTHKHFLFCIWPGWMPYLSMNFSWCWSCFTPLVRYSNSLFLLLRSAFSWRSGCCTSAISLSIIPPEHCNLHSSICSVPTCPRVLSFHLHSKKRPEWVCTSKPVT